jgi:hypothetical protein
MARVSHRWQFGHPSTSELRKLYPRVAMVKSAQHCISDLLDEWPESLPYMAHTSNPTFLLRIQRMRFSEGTGHPASCRVRRHGPHHDIGALRQLIDDLVLAFVAHCEPTTTTLATPCLRRTNGPVGAGPCDLVARARERCECAGHAGRRRLFKPPAAIGVRGKVRRVRHPARARPEVMGVTCPTGVTRRDLHTSTKENPPCFATLP